MKKHITATVEENILNKLEQFADDNCRSKSNAIELLLALAFQTLKEKGFKY